jgi:hypothetical protein
MKTSRVQAEKAIKICLRAGVGKGEVLIRDLKPVHGAEDNYWLFTISLKKLEDVWFDDVSVIYMNPQGILVKLSEKTIINKLNLS